MSDQTRAAKLAAADQDLANVELVLDSFIKAWTDVLDEAHSDSELEPYVACTTRRVALLHSLIDATPIPRVSMTAVLALAVDRLTVGTDPSIQDLEGVYRAE